MITYKLGQLLFCFISFHGTHWPTKFLSLKSRVALQSDCCLFIHHSKSTNVIVPVIWTGQRATSIHPHFESFLIHIMTSSYTELFVFFLYIAWLNLSSCLLLNSCCQESDKKNLFCNIYLVSSPVLSLLTFTTNSDINLSIFLL